MENLKKEKREKVEKGFQNPKEYDTIPKVRESQSL